MDTGLAGRIALVTGAAGGIGRACACALATEGAKVVLADVDARPREQASRRGRGRCLVRGGRRPKRTTCGALVTKIVEDFGSLDVLVTCAGVFHATPFDEISARGVGSDPGRQPPRNVSDLPGGGEGDDSERARTDRDDRVARRAGRRSRRRARRTPPPRRESWRSRSRSPASPALTGSRRTASTQASSRRR